MISNQDEEAFQIHLNANPRCWSTRVVYSDFLEDCGRDTEAQLQRWMASNQKSPSFVADYGWYWYNADIISGTLHSCGLPGKIYDQFKKVPVSTSGKEYGQFGSLHSSRTRAEAEDVLMSALIKLGVIS